MKGKELLETYPKVAKIIKDWFIQRMLDNLEKFEGASQEFKDTIREQGVANETLIHVIDKNPSSLFEVFDSVQVYVGIVVEQLPETEKVVFNYYICPKGKCLESPVKDFLKRKDAEHYAMLDAVQYIDNNFDEIYSFFASKIWK